MRVQVLSEKEVQVLLTYLAKRPVRDRLIVRLMLQCGLRVGEVSALNVENVWRGGYVHPAVNLPQGTTKGHIARYVDMPEPVRDLVKEHIDGKSPLISPLAASSPLFIGDKVPIRLLPGGIGRIVGKISRASIGRFIHPHILRHTYATILMKYTNMRVVQTLLGHASISTTQIYTHVSSEDCKNAVNQAFNR